jgi:hypothetical protein
MHIKTTYGKRIKEKIRKKQQHRYGPMLRLAYLMPDCWL